MTEPALQHETVSERILALAAEILAWGTGFPLELSAYLIDKCFRLTLQEHGLSSLPPNVESLAPELRYKFVRRLLGRVAEELYARKVSDKVIAQVLTDLDEFYRGARNIS